VRAGQLKRGPNPVTLKPVFKDRTLHDTILKTACSHRRKATGSAEKVELEEKGRVGQEEDLKFGLLCGGFVTNGLPRWRTNSTCLTTTLKGLWHRLELPVWLW
jgi:hypothetical protein